MNPLQVNEDNMTDSEKRKKIFKLMFVVYIIAIVFPYLICSSPLNEIDDWMESGEISEIKFHSLVEELYHSRYEGNWIYTSEKPKHKFSSNGGKCYINFNRFIRNNVNEYEIIMRLNNGPYLTEGSIILTTTIHPLHWSVDANQTYLIGKPTGRSSLSSLLYEESLKLQTVDEKQLNSTNITFSFVRDPHSLNKLDFIIDVNLQGLLEIQMSLGEYTERTHKLVLLGVMILGLSIISLTGTTNTVNGILQQPTTASQFSFLTNLIIMTIDACICLVCFVFIAFDERNCALFLIPAFLYCYVFGNLDFLILQSIYDEVYKSSSSLWEVVKFHIPVLIALLLIYPFLYFTNLNVVFYLSLSLLSLPQIYTNAIAGIRPEFNAYYLRHILSRHAFILYTCCFPFNAFDLQPNYSITFYYCLSLLVQGLMLYIQKISGPRAILPKFLTPPEMKVYRTSRINTLGEAFCQKMCSICLNQLAEPPLTDYPSQSPDELLDTPCGHTYHAPCLMAWIQIKKECPDCRRKLPPVLI